MLWTQAFQRLRLCRLYVQKEGDFMPVYGYARVSTDGQTLDAQVAQLKVAGAEKVFHSGAKGVPLPAQGRSPQEPMPKPLQKLRRREERRAQSHPMSPASAMDLEGR